jgi:transcriptional regulator with XRE-family HTH domain
MTGGQLRAARGLARLDQSQLAQEVGISIHMVKRFERTVGPIPASAAIEAAIRQALADAGANLIFNAGEGPGLRITDEGVLIVEEIAASRAPGFQAEGSHR